jgi:hypothetical protein
MDLPGKRKRTSKAKLGLVNKVKRGAAEDKIIKDLEDAISEFVSLQYGPNNQLKYS